MSGVYIHVPYCRSKCGYCSFFSVTDSSSVPAYLNALEREIEKRTLKTRAGNRPAADTVYIGGGTPSVLPRGSVSRILKKIRQSFDLTPDCEVTIEANPESCGGEFAAEIASAGVNRVSLGLQTHDGMILKTIGRPHNADDFFKSLKKIEQAGIKNIGVDLMTGLPGQTKPSFSESLKRVAALPEIKHVSFYALSVEEGTPLGRSGFIPDDDLQAGMYEDGVIFLENAGFCRYEVSNFARAGFRSRHNQKYWNGEEYFGFGPGAHSFEHGGAEYGMPVRIENNADLALYNAGNFEKGREIITPEIRAGEMIMLLLRTREGLNLEKLKSETGRDLLAAKAGEINFLTSLGLVEAKNGTLRATDAGFYVLNSVILKLM